eukprot:Opistho-1_new@14162
MALAIARAPRRPCALLRTRFTLQTPTTPARAFARPCDSHSFSNGVSLRRRALHYLPPSQLRVSGPSASRLRIERHFATTPTGRPVAQADAYAGTKQPSLNSTGSQDNNADDDARDPAVVRLLNTAIRKHPAEAIVSLFSLEILSIYGTHAVLVASGVEFPTEFAVAFVIGRALRRVRLPLELAVAAALTRVFPSLRRIKLTDLKHAMPLIFRPREQQQEQQQQATSPSLVRRAVGALGDVMDSYGAAYLVSARFVGASIVMSLYTAMRAGGFDAQFIVDKLEVIGIHAGTGTGAVVGTWAGAVVLSSVFYPLTICCSAYLAPNIARLSSALKAVLRRRP